MIQDDPQIIWEKWRDPYGSDDISEINDYLMNNNNTEEYNDEEDASDSTLNNHDIKNNFFKPKMPFMFTPMGIIPYTESTASGKLFNFWTGHTNFNISKKISDIIENTEGIETFDIFTRYRFRIAVGKAFIDSDVMRTINKNIYQFFLE